MFIRLEARNLPGSRCGPGPEAPDGYSGIRVGVQARNDPQQVMDPVSGGAVSATWSLECKARITADGVDITGPQIQGRPNRRFIYLSWLSDQGPGPLGMFRRAKLDVELIPAALVEQAGASGTIVGRLDLTDNRGNPLCAGVRPPAIEWSVE